LAYSAGCAAKTAEATLRNQIAKRVMLAVLVSVGHIKRGYTAPQLAALAQMGASLQDMDIFAVRARQSPSKSLEFHLCPAYDGQPWFAKMRTKLFTILWIHWCLSLVNKLQKLTPSLGKNNLVK